MLNTIETLAHLGHWTEAALFLPAGLLVLVASVRSVLDRRATSLTKEETHE